MKNILFALCMASAAVAPAASVKLTFDAPPPTDNIRGYGVDQKDGAGEWRTVMGLPYDAAVISPAFEVMGLTEGAHTFRVFAIGATADLVSPPSNEITVTVPPAPKNLRIKVTIVGSADGTRWEPVPDAELTALVPEDAARKFFRGDITIAPE